MTEYFECSKESMEVLKSRDPKMAALIDSVGVIRRELDPDLFSSIVHQMIAQQISNAAQAAIWMRLQNLLGEVTPERILEVSEQDLKSCGMSLRKAGYIQSLARQIVQDTFHLDAVASKPDEEAVKTLCSLQGVGEWTAEMILLFCLQRPDVFSFRDAGIIRGLRMVYGLESIDRKLFEAYRERFSPYGSTACLYLWAAAAGQIEGLEDPAAKNKRKKMAEQQ